ncbi:chromatin associated protein KTI12 [Crepidotus variabilis]|uniref:Chromatin associated protein KTI12 n=1 Tax=Crepidotus variabilis TaxID=179855 RepID=A0A9P6EML4_9AGAR|nr:chromatin associated protein KTI12 [Crepidotus variabilis]
MALITISGYPVSGKSTRSSQLSKYLEGKISEELYIGPFKSVTIVSDHSLGLSPTVYNDSTSEKPARGTIFTNLQRQLSVDSIVILDSLNYIKGFRYQIYCAAREIRLRTCTIHVVAPSELCQKWNSLRPIEEAYSKSTLENLIMRYEEPSSMVRWDAPLFTVLWSDNDIPGAQIWEAITSGNLKPPNAGTLSVAKAPTDALHVLEQTTNTMCSMIVAASSSQPEGGATSIIIGEAKVLVGLPPRIVTVSEMQRVKRQFVAIHKKAITLGTTERGGVHFGEANIARKFAEYIAEHIQQ